MRPPARSQQAAPCFPPPAGTSLRCSSAAAGIVLACAEAPPKGRVAAAFGTARSSRPTEEQTKTGGQKGSDRMWEGASRWDGEEQAAHGDIPHWQGSKLIVWRRVLFHTWHTSPAASYRYMAFLFSQAKTNNHTNCLLYLYVRSKVLPLHQVVQIKQSWGVVEAVLLQAVTYALLKRLPTDRRAVQTLRYTFMGHIRLQINK